MGFADSFSEAFNKTAPVAAAGAMDILKEKIKANAEATQSSAAIDLLHAKVYDAIASKASTMNPDDLKTKIKETDKTFEKLRSAGLDASKSESIAKILFPGELADPAIQAQRDNTGTIEYCSLCQSPPS